MAKSSSFLSGRPVFEGRPQREFEDHLGRPNILPSPKIAMSENTGIGGGLPFRDKHREQTKSEKILRSKDFQELEINQSGALDDLTKSAGGNFNLLVIGALAYFFLKG